MKQRISLLILLPLIATFLAACASLQRSTATPVTLKDGSGREVKIGSPAKRIISLAPSNTEILYAIQAGDKLVGRDDFSNFPAEVSSVPLVGGSMGNYNFEQIASLKPDLVLASSLNTPEQVKTLEELGLTVYLLPNPADLEGLFQNLATLGTLTGNDSQAGELIKSLKSRVSAVEEKISSVTTQPVVYYELDGTDPTQPWTTGSGTFLANLIGMAGGKNAGDELTGDFAQISLEALLSKNPDLIILGDSNYGMDAKQVASRVGWNGLKAVQDGQVYPFDDDLVSRPGPRLVDGLEQLAKLIHPEAFKQ
jgi:iron complex transport system substrate-binding protein